MADLRTVQIRGEDYGQSARDHQFYQWSGSWSAWVEFLRRARADNSPGGRAFAQELAAEGGRSHHFGRWSGVDQTPDSFLESATYRTAYAEFQRAEAKLEATRFQPGRPIPAVAGGAWVIPLVLAGNPMSARLKTRTKLPPVNLELAVNVFAGIQWRDITASIARIARASWDYIQAGGAVSITVHYVHRFGKAQEGHEGVLISIKVPLTSASAFASACSTQEYRGASMAFAGGALSPIKDDSLPLFKWVKPSLLHVTGRVQDDAKARAALNIKG
jgi:hypothetical protein